MKKLLLIFLSFVCLAAAKAQDKIITIQQDTIHCRIVSINADRISYEQKTADNYIVGKSISTSEVVQYLRTGEPGSFGKQIARPKIKRPRPEHRFLFSLQGGLSHSLTDYSEFKNLMLSAGSPASDINDYIHKLENGYHLNTSLHYLLTSFFGLGADYNLFYSTATGDFLSPGYGEFNFPIYANLRISERLYTQFAGASLLFQQFPDKKHRIKISETLSPGIVLFRDESRNNIFQVYTGGSSPYNGQAPQYFDQANSLTKSTAFGAKGSLSVEYGLTRQLSFGLAANFMWAKLHKVSSKDASTENNDQKLGEPIDISHIDCGLVVRYNF